MDTIVIQKKNEAKFLVGCDNGIAMELSEYFSFFAKGYKFMPAFKNKIWDGKIRLFNHNTYELPVGLLWLLKVFCEKRDYRLEYEDSEFGGPEDLNEINPNEIMEFIKSLNLRSKGKPIEIRDYQFNAICKGIREKRAVLLSPTGSGKSLIIYVLLRWYLDNYEDKALVVVPTTSLVQQMFSDFDDYSSDDETFNCKDDCHVIYSGQPKNRIEERVFISTWQSIYKLPSTWFRQFGVVFGDECHLFAAKSLTSIMDKSAVAAYRFGTTGTLDGSECNELVLQGLFGKVTKVTTTKTLQDNDTLADLNISILILEYPENLRQEQNGKKYQDEIDFIVRYEPRNKLIRNLTLDQKGNTLVLFQFVEKHGKILYDLIASKAVEGRKVFFVSGATEASDREAIRKITESQEDAIIVASMGTFSTGINIKNLHNIIFASPSKSQVKVLQSIGRGLRKSDDGRTTNLYDIADDLSIGKDKNYTILHSMERVKIYKREKFKFKIYKVKI